MAARVFERDFDHPPERVWPILGDTARFNEASGLPKHKIEETPEPDGSVTAIASTRFGPFALRWREIPVNWVAPRWFEHRRDFLVGPLRSLTARLELAPRAGGCRARYRVEAVPNGLVGRLLLAGGLLRAAGGAFLKAADQVELHLATPELPAFPYRAPPASEAAKVRTADLVAEIERAGHGHGLAPRLAVHLLEGQEVDLLHLRPLRLARTWSAAPRDTIELCLSAARAGLLELTWSLLCPRCRIAKAEVPSLDRLPKGAHCSSCNIDYEGDFASNVELAFRPAPAIRPIEGGEYCMMGPMTTPHVRLQVTLPPHGRRVEAAELPGGAYRVRTLEPGAVCDLDWPGGGFPEIVLGDETIAAGVPAETGTVALENRTARARTLVLEERPWASDVLTAERVTNLQAFRDLFSDQVLRPGDEVSLRSVTLLFTDLSGSTALYGRIGDAAAYHLVREHFAFLTAIVREHDGSVVKTIGDAIMAAFAEPGQGLKAALAVRAAVADFNAKSGLPPIAIKLGLHRGPCIVVTLNGRLDYFGSTVNLAARLQGEARGGDIVLSTQFAQDPAVGPILAGRAAGRESARLRGFENPVEFLRLGD
ncbi:MAG: adenylate/guanylate cyclase domain-containing protein [Kiloniellales bacterium]